MNHRWMLGVVLLVLGCASVPPVQGTRRELHQSSRAGAGFRWQARPVARAAAPHLEQRAVRDAIGEVKNSVDGIARGLARLEDREAGIGGHGGVFTRYLEHGSGQVARLRGLLKDATMFVDASDAAADADLARGLLQMAGRRIEAALGSAAVRIQAGQVLMAQGHQDLPKGVREALGEGPEVRGMHETGRAGAGMADGPRHHVMPREHREWFERRGFKGAMDIDQFCVRLERSQHEAIHGGGDWRLERTWPGEWNQMIMKAMERGEARVRRLLTRNEVLAIVADRMKYYDIPMNFVRGSRR
ncbi:hypothetical protein D7W81_12675 [Corallococcus aberystwythensis]|uniref:DUF2380 domain-containing protein n=1 Tax=Corallococcus aberystwythensis TaxID=2316722 RepID=A0A3A8QII7_9BACT|nr:hypothetical protein [Corallococcus aberystwythensis]RKH68387.1 hypothetical protein D7W81_12675 [Corallococcus aberystwythensis]